MDGSASNNRMANQTMTLEAEATGNGSHRTPSPKSIGAGDRISQAAVRELRLAVSGPVHLRGEVGYVDEVRGFNTISTTNPDLVVGAMDEADVQAAVRWAVKHDVTVHPQATGHGAYRTLDHGLLLKTNRLDHLIVDVEQQKWTMGAGLRWMDVLPHLHNMGLGAVTGSSKTVGVVGLILGGGIGPIGRTFGMAADRVRAFRVVDANGNALVADRDSNSDLFWALRGGKVGLAVVTEVTIQALPMPFLYAGGIYYPESEINRLLHAWVDWIPGLPEAVSTSIAIVRLPEDIPAPLGGRTWFHFRFAYVTLGATTEQLREHGEKVLASWRRIAGPGAVDLIDVLPSDRVGEIHQDPVGPVPLFEVGEFLQSIDHEFVDLVLEHVGAGVVTPLAVMEIRYHSGAYAREPEWPSAIGGRKEPFTFLLVGHPEEPTLPADKVEAAAFAIRDVIKPWQGKEVNFNWANPLTKPIFENRLWPPDVRDRLKAVRAKYDPDGVFEFGT